MEIHIKTIPHTEQRYQTPGDWWFDDDEILQIRVSELGDESMEFLIADHELQEAVLCTQRGISELDIQQFDIEFEEKRALGEFAKDEEPGLHPVAPYRMEHHTANVIEGIMLRELGVDEGEYDKKVISLLKIKRT